MEDLNNTIKKTGIVKWFSQEKGYGYINNKENIDLYFGVKDVIGADLPEYGDRVEYTEYVGREEITAAKDVIIIEKKNPIFKKVRCESCQIEVRPKPWHFGGTDYTNVKTAYLCPHCGEKLYESGGGFNKIARFLLLFIAIIIFSITYIVT